MKETLLNKATTVHRLLQKLNDFEEGLRMKVNGFEVYFTAEDYFFLRVKSPDFKIEIMGNGSFEFSSSVDFETVVDIGMIINGMMLTVIKELEAKVREEAGNTIFDPVTV